MFDSTKILTNIMSVNQFDVVERFVVYEGSHPLTFTIRLWQSDRNERYIPNATTTVMVAFMRSDTVGQTNVDQTVTKILNRAYSTTDGSIWSCTLSQAEVAKLVTGGMKITIVEGVLPNQVTTVVYSKMSIVKYPNSDEALE